MIADETGDPIVAGQALEHMEFPLLAAMAPARRAPDASQPGKAEDPLKAQRNLVAWDLGVAVFQ